MAFGTSPHSGIVIGYMQYGSVVALTNSTLNSAMTNGNISGVIVGGVYRDNTTGNFINATNVSATVASSGNFGGICAYVIGSGVTTLSYNATSYTVNRTIACVGTKDSSNITINALVKSGCT